MNKLIRSIILVILVSLFLFSMLIWIVSVFSGDSAGIAVGFSLMAVLAVAISWAVDELC